MQARAKRPGELDAVARLIDASAALVQSRPLNETLDIILDLSGSLIDADGYGVWGFDAVTDSWSLLASRGLSEAFRSQRLQQLAGRAVSLTEPIVVEDVDDDERIETRRDLYHEEGIKSVLIQPLPGPEQTRGTLVFYYKEPQKFDEDLLQLAQALSNLVSAAIHEYDLAKDEEANRNRLKLLAEAGEILSSSLDYEETLRNVARLCVPAIADWCAIDILEGDQLQRVAVYHRDPEKLAIAEQLRQNTQTQEGTAVERIRNLEARFLPTVPMETLIQNMPEERRRAIQGLGLRSAISVPIHARGQPLGSLTLVWAETERYYDRADLSTAEELARRAGTAIENARLFRASETAQRQLKLSNQAKDEFLAMMSHELRSPVTAIYGGARIAARPDNTLPPDRTAELMQTVVSEADRLRRLVENLLLIARIDLGQEIEATAVDMNSVLDRSVSSFTRSRPQRAIEVSSGAEPIVALGEETLVEQVVHNLVENADKYSPAGEPVAINLRSEGDEVVIAVRDSGPGVPMDELELIFDSFYRSHATRDAAPGKGLGLALCKRVVTAMRGSIQATNRPEGGLEVVVRLPRTADGAS